MAKTQPSSRKSAHTSTSTPSSSRTTRSKASRGNSTPGKSTQALDQVDLQLIELVVQHAEMVASNPPVGTTGVLLAQRQMAELVERRKIADPRVLAVVRAVMRTLVGQALASLNDGTMAYLGPEFSYSHLAAIKCFGDTPQLVPVASIAAVFESIVRHDCVAGVVPIENSTDGRVVDTLGMFLRHKVRICGEVLLPIHHNLLSRTERSQITEVYSKPQALSQCRTWLAQNLPAARPVEMSSTAAAAQLAADRPGAAAIASLEAGTQYGLDVIAASIEDNKNNVTRFAILGNHPTKPSGKDKTALLFQVKHQPGALADAMMLFKKGGLNLTWIESFPLPGSTSEYLFFVELEGHELETHVRDVIDKLAKRSERFEILGSYPRGHV